MTGDLFGLNRHIIDSPKKFGFFLHFQWVRHERRRAVPSLIMWAEIATISSERGKSASYGNPGGGSGVSF